MQNIYLPDRTRFKNELFDILLTLDKRFKKEKLFDKNLVKLIMKYDKHECDFYSTKNGLYRCHVCVYKYTYLYPSESDDDDSICNNSCCAMDESCDISGDEN